jgi:hypothetical protein
MRCDTTSATARTLLRQPLFTLVVVVSLALGIGANAAVFQLINAVRLRTLPVPDAQQLVSVTVTGGHRGLGLSNGFNADLTFALWERIREHQLALADPFAWGVDPLPLGSGADTQILAAVWMSGGLFPALRISPARGRLFTDADDRPGCGAGSGAQLRVLAASVRRRRGHCRQDARDGESCDSDYRRRSTRDSSGWKSAKGSTWRCRSALKPRGATRRRAATCGGSP